MNFNELWSDFEEKYEEKVKEAKKINQDPLHHYYEYLDIAKIVFDVLEEYHKKMNEDKC